MQSIDVKFSEHAIGTLTTTFHKPGEKENPYVRFWYNIQLT